MQDLVKFENLIWLFGYNTYNRDTIRMDLDEAGYIYCLIKMLKEKTPGLTVTEIGTYKGGSTILMLGAGARVITVDNYSSKTFNNYTKNPVDDVIQMAKDYGLEHRLTTITGDSRAYPNEALKCDILFIDGNHSYEGVKADYNHWISTLKAEGHLIFHDSCIAREGATGREGVIKLMKEIPYKKLTEIGSITHFIKKNL